MEWLIVGLFAVFGYIQTDRLHDAKADADKWQEVATNNYLEAQEAKRANDTLNTANAALKESGAKCNRKLNEALDSIHNYEASDRIRRATVDELKRKLEQSDGSDNGDLCRVPDWVVLESGTAATD